MSNSRKILANKIQDAQLKYSYFLLASAGAALGFGLQKLDGQPPTRMLLIALAAFVFWLLSFAFGCFSILKYHGALKHYHSVLVLMSRTDELEENKEERSDTLDLMMSAATWRRRFASLQLGALFVGVVLFATWRVAAIYYAPSTAGTIGLHFLQ